VKLPALLINKGQQAENRCNAQNVAAAPSRVVLQTIPTNAVCVNVAGHVPVFKNRTGGWDRLLNWVAHPLAFGISKGAVFDS